MVDESHQLKEEANELYRKGEYEKSLEVLMSALKLTKDDNLISVLYKNAAANSLKLSNYEETIKFCDKALAIKPQDLKALYRRSCAQEALGHYELAFHDAQKALIASPRDSECFKPILCRLQPMIQKKREKGNRVHNMAEKMFSIVFGSANNLFSDDEIEKSFNNIIVLCRDLPGIDALIEKGLIQKLTELMEIKRPTERQVKQKIMGIRVITQIVQHSEPMCTTMLTILGIPFFVGLQDVAFGVKDKSLLEEAHVATQFLWQKILDGLIGLKKGGTADRECLKENSTSIDTLLTTLAVTINSRSIDGFGRDCVIQFFIKNIDWNLVPWGETFLNCGALTKLCEVAAEVPELGVESGIELSPNTKSLTSMLLAKVYENMFHDKARQRYSEIIEEFAKEMLISPDINTKLQVTTLMTVLLLGPVDVGNTMIGKQGILQMILMMANSEEYLLQKTAVEAIVAAASKKDKAKTIIAEGINILKRLYQSKNDDIKVRALVGICKLGSTGGTDAAAKPFSEGSTLKLSEACCRFLLNPSKDVATQRWAVEGLSYLTLDAEVKEKLIEDTTAMKTMLEVSRHATSLSEMVYPIILCLVNLANAYDKQEIIPEMVEIAKFAKQHIPEDHILDDPDFVEKRIEVLANLGITSCLVNLAGATESINVKELISRILNAICEKNNLRGIVVAEGGARELVKLALNGTKKGKIFAAQALARIGINYAPSMVFPGQRIYEVIKPLLSLLDLERKALENFEALLALANIASESDSCRQRIFDEGGFMDIEHYMYEEHPKLKMAAVQCILNLCMSERGVKCFEGDNDRVKFMMLLCSSDEEISEEDKDELETMKAAAGVLALLTAQSRTVCGKVLTVIKDPIDTLIWLVANPLPDLQLRGVTIVKNIIAMDEEFAQRIVGSPCFEVIMALSGLQLYDEKVPLKSKEEIKILTKVRNKCKEALELAENMKLIKKS